MILNVCDDNGSKSREQRRQSTRRRFVAEKEERQERKFATFSIQLEPEVLDAFKKFAKEREMSISGLARLAIKRLLAMEGNLPEHSPITPREDKESGV